MNSRTSADQLQGLTTHGDTLIDHLESRDAGLQRLTGSLFNILLGVCLGMLAAYGLHIRWMSVDFMIVGPLMGGAGGALARLLSRDFKAHKRQERLRLERLESAARLQMASQIVDFLRNQGRVLPPEVQDGAWAEVSRLVSNQRGYAATSTVAPMVFASALPKPAKD
jgi:hypothetical protein